MNWQPIETAPRDGSMFLVWIRACRYCESDEGQSYEMDCSQYDFGVWKHDLAIGEGYVDYFSHPFADSEHVTHWMPLPEPPK